MSFCIKNNNQDSTTVLYYILGYFTNNLNWRLEAFGSVFSPGFILITSETRNNDIIIKGEGPSTFILTEKLKKKWFGFFPPQFHPPQTPRPPPSLRPPDPYQSPANALQSLYKKWTRVNLNSYIHTDLCRIMEKWISTCWKEAPLCSSTSASILSPKTGDSW